jgi:NADP-dependent 3-hydroxy acid dehydrogenase YdfG
VADRTLIVCGYGPGIADAVAARFGAEGFAVALVGRSADKLTAAAQKLEQTGITAATFTVDLARPEAMDALMNDVRARLGRITVIHWNAPAPAHLAGDLTTAAPAELRAALDVSVISLVAALQSALPDLRAQRDAAVLVTTGAVSLHDPKLDAMAVSDGFMGAAIAKAAQHRVVSLLARKLRRDGIFVGEVVVAGIVKGTAYDNGDGILTTEEVAGEFWRLYRHRPEAFVSMLGVGVAGRGRP